jgi:low affinity Fe/Cu permease
MPLALGDHDHAAEVAIQTAQLVLEPELLAALGRPLSFPRPQNKDAQVIHLKPNEIVAATAGASNRLINVEDLTEDEVRTLYLHYQWLVPLAKSDVT